MIGTPVLRVFDRMGHAGLVLSMGGEVLAVNACAQRLMRDLERPCDGPDGTACTTIKRLLARSRVRVPRGPEDWILVPRENKRPLILNAMPLPGPEAEAPYTVLLLIDLEQAPPLNRAALEQVFGLTPAEAKLAALLAGGATVAEAARRQGIGLATVRTQLRAIFGKTQTHRQAELVMLVSRLAMLP